MVSFKQWTVKSLVMLAMLAPAMTIAGPIEYTVTAGTAPGFAGSFLHSATSAHDDGYWMNGNTARISGSIVIDTDADTASGSVSTSASDTDFGEGAGAWELVITGMFDSSTFADTFVGGESLLLALNYDLFLNDTLQNQGIFYFADKAFNSGDGAPNNLVSDQLVLWGNNWFNDGTTPKPGTFALGIDLIGEGTPVPEPALLLLLSISLLGLALGKKKEARG